jgi:hypothetical protein
MHSCGQSRFFGDHPIGPTAPTGAHHEATKAELVEIEGECDKICEQLRMGPNAARRKRHKCYAMLMKARCQVLRNAIPEAGVNLARAVAALPRAAGAPERTAAGIVHLFEAESMLLRSFWLETKNEAENKVEPDPHVAMFLDRCEALLEQAQPEITQDGRSENRWRVFFSFLKAKANFKRYLIYREQSANRECLFNALRHVVAGLTNTGIRSDRRPLLVQLYLQICHVAQLSGNAPVDLATLKFNGALPADPTFDPARVQELERWKIQVGLPVNDENIDVKVLKLLAAGAKTASTGSNK